MFNACLIIIHIFERVKNTNKINGFFIWAVLVCVADNFIFARPLFWWMKNWGVLWLVTKYVSPITNTIFFFTMQAPSMYPQMCSKQKVLIQKNKLRKSPPRNMSSVELVQFRMLTSYFCSHYNLTNRYSKIIQNSAVVKIFAFRDLHNWFFCVSRKMIGLRPL